MFNFQLSRCRDLNSGPLPYQGSALPLSYNSKKIRAENGTQTRDPQLGRLVLYRLSYFRMISLKSGAKIMKRAIICKSIAKLQSFFHPK